jgi:hypothetical protein
LSFSVPVGCFQAVIRCKKAQAVARPHNNKKKVKAGAVVEAKLAEMLLMTKNDDFGELAVELELLSQLVANMQKGVLEPLLESVETIERRMKSYQGTLHGNQDSMDKAAKENLQEFRAMKMETPAQKGTRRMVQPLETTVAPQPPMKGSWTNSITFSTFNGLPKSVCPS